MKRLIKTSLTGLMALATCLGGNAYAGEALQQINAEVQRTASQIDAAHGVLLTTQERTELKLSLIIQKVKADTTADANLSVAEQTNATIETYEITDPANQRKLLIEFEAQANLIGASAGVEP